MSNILFLLFYFLLNVPVLIVQHVTFLVYVFVMAVWRNGTETQNRNQSISQVVPAEFDRWAPNSCPSWDRPNLSKVKRWCNIQYTNCLWKSLISHFFPLCLRYVSAVVQWCDWVKQTDQSMSAVGVALSDSTHSDTPQPITRRY